MRKGFSVFLAFGIWVFSLYPGLASHYCSGELAAVRLVSGYGTASCGMNGSCQTWTDHPGESLQQLPCCGDVFLDMALDPFQSSPVSGWLIYPIFLPGNNHPFIPCLVEGSVSGFYSLYRPPPGIPKVELSAIGVFII
ncbi:MAG: hypothetical protein R6U86_10720 [Bacteroidales bacterium]